MKQLNLIQNEKVPLVHGGVLAMGKRKSKRPLDSKKPIHVVLKTTDTFRLLRNKRFIEKLIQSKSRSFGVKIYSMGVQADHIHLNISFGSRKIYVMWIRALSGAMVKKVAGLKFSLPPFTRVGSWGKGFRKVQAYVLKNYLEGEFLLAMHLLADKNADHIRSMVRPV